MFRATNLDDRDQSSGAVEQDLAKQWTYGGIDQQAAERILSPSNGWSMAVNRIPGLLGKCLPLPVDYVERALLRIELLQNVDNLLKCDSWRVEKWDVSWMSESDIRSLLAARASPNRDWVSVLRPIDSAGLSMKYADFVSNYERIWRPWGDDLLITGPDFSWLVEMNHEELLTFLGLEER